MVVKKVMKSGITFYDYARGFMTKNEWTSYYKVTDTTMNEIV